MAAKNPAIKRIHADIRELTSEPSPNYHAAPLEDNLFDWHFTLRGPQGTDFQGGIYHGRIQLPAEWPFKPPDITFYTENGRFRVGSKICLSISAHHPEQWQPAWGIRLILEALITFMPTEGGGAIGSLDWPPEERRRLARLSTSGCCPKCGALAELLPDPAAAGAPQTNGGAASLRYAEQLRGLHLHGAKEDAKPPAEGGPEQAGGGEGAGLSAAAGPGHAMSAAAAAALQRAAAARDGAHGGGATNAGAAAAAAAAVTSGDSAGVNGSGQNRSVDNSAAAAADAAPRAEVPPPSAAAVAPAAARPAAAAAPAVRRQHGAARQQHQQQQQQQQAILTQDNMYAALSVAIMALVLYYVIM